MEKTIKDDIEYDFYECIGLYENILCILDSITSNKNEDKEINNRIMQARLNETVVMIGRVLELGVKYLLKKEHYKLIPNITYYDFSEGAPIYKKNTLKNLMSNRKINITQTDLDNLSNIKDQNNQLFHNFDYLSAILSLVDKKVYDNIIKLSEYKIFASFLDEHLKNYNEIRDQKEYLRFFNHGYTDIQIEELNEEDKEKIIPFLPDSEDKEFDDYESIRDYNQTKVDEFTTIPKLIVYDLFIEWAFFPEKIDEPINFIKNGSIEETSKEERDLISYARNVALKLQNNARKNGDIFTKVRYYRNLYDDRQYSLNEISDLSKSMSNLIEFIKNVHKYDDLHISPEFINYKNECIIHHDYFNRSVDSINTIFDRYGYNLELVEKVLESRYTINSSKNELENCVNFASEYFKKNNIESNGDFYLENFIVLSNFSYTPELLELFFDNGIYDLYEMNEIISPRVLMRDNTPYIRSFNEIKEALDRRNKFR